MPLFRCFTLQVALILYIHQCNGFMFQSLWFRGSTDKIPTTASYTVQNFKNENVLQKSQIQRVENGVKDSSKYNIPEKDAPRNTHRATSSHKPNLHGFNAVVVHSLPTFFQPLHSPNIGFVAIPASNYPYLHYKDETKTEPPITSFTTTLIPQKSVQVEINYQDDKVTEKFNENAILQQRKPNSTQPFNSTIAELTLNTKNYISSEDLKKADLPSQPIKILGLSPIYNIPSLPKENLTFTPPIVLEPIAPLSVVKGLPLGAPGFFRNVHSHRSVSDRSELPNTNAISSTLPVVPQQEIKQPSPASGFLCPDCFLPPKFLSYPAFKLSEQKPCQHDHGQYLTPYEDNMAYVVLAPQPAKNT